MNRIAALCVCLAATLVLAPGCLIGPRGDSKYISKERMEQGLTLVLPGIEGKGYLNRGIRDGLADRGLNTAIQIHDWTLGPIMAPLNQMLVARAERKGKELAADIMAYRDLHPDRPVILVCHSGGCAIAIFAAEAMPRGQSIDAIIMLAPSIGPDYDLTAGLMHVSGQLISYYSPKDRVLLGAGTFILGNMDGQHTSGAGRVGFTLPRTSSPETAEQYRKLKQVEWRPDMALSGCDGGHLDWADSRFVRDYIAPEVQQQMAESLARKTRPQTQPAAPLARPAAPAPRPAVPAVTPAPAVRRPPTSQPVILAPERKLPTR